jgi:hypothetical protein
MPDMKSLQQHYEGKHSKLTFNPADYDLSNVADSSAAHAEIVGKVKKSTKKGVSTLM